MSKKRFRVAFSFAGEKRDFVAKIAAVLAKQFTPDAVLYDKYHEAEFARYDLGIHLPKLYGEQSDLIVTVLCPNYDQKLWTGWEWLHIYGLLNKSDGSRVMPCRFEGATADGFSPAAGFIELDKKTEEEAAVLILERLALNEGKSKDYYIQPSAGRFFENLPDPNPNADLIGRDKKLEELNAWWGDSHINLVSIEGWAGVGKTALVKRWLANMNGRRFGWSFSLPDLNEERAASEKFFSNAIRWFGGEPSSQLPENGEILVRLVRRQRTLLVLDGLEVLQFPPGPAGGELKYPEIQYLVSELAKENLGLCVVTTRHRLVGCDLGHNSVRQIYLNNLEQNEGMELLRKLCAEENEPVPEPEDLAEIVNEHDGHPLSLCMLGIAIKHLCSGDAKQWRKLSLFNSSLKESQHAEQAMARYKTWFANGPEVQVLRMLGLVNRVTQSAELEILRKSPAISSLTDALVDQQHPEWNAQWNEVKSRLRQLRLLSNEPRGWIACPPIVRSYFAYETTRNAFIEGHRRLLEFHEREAPIVPIGEDEVRRMFPIVFHGCCAGEYTRMLKDFVRLRILQWSPGARFYATNELGLWEETLEAMQCFFKKPWKDPVDELSEPTDRAFVLTSAGTCLRALTRFNEAIDALEKGYQVHEEHEQWSEAALALRMLNQAYIAAGDVRKAKEFGGRSVDYADKGGRAGDRISSLARYAEALHHGSNEEKDHKEALRHFDDALKISGSGTCATTEILDGFWEFEYCDLLITLGDYAQARERASRVLTRELMREDLKKHQPLWGGLSNVILGRVDVIVASQAAGAERRRLFEKAEWHFNGAVMWISMAGERQHIPLGYLARAQFFGEMKEWERAQHDLERAKEEARRSQMRLHMTDCHLLSARLEIDRNGRQSNWEEVEINLAKADALITRTGYRRRAGQLKELREESDWMKR